MKVEQKNVFVGNWYYTEVVRNNSLTKFNKGSDLIFIDDESGYFSKQNGEKINFTYEVKDTTILFVLKNADSNLFFSKQTEFDYELRNEEKYTKLFLKSVISDEKHVFVKSK